MATISGELIPRSLDKKTPAPVGGATDGRGERWEGSLGTDERRMGTGMKGSLEGSLGGSLGTGNWERWGQTGEMGTGIDWGHAFIDWGQALIGDRH
ncbi:MAG: hypothetical protein GY904_07350 [Planctomycetaceae bacterium]|nr:hypothetical protein [Planctomycetaceae bacterium]